VFDIKMMMIKKVREEEEEEEEEEKAKKALIIKVKIGPFNLFYLKKSLLIS